MSMNDLFSLFELKTQNSTKQVLKTKAIHKTSSNNLQVKMRGKQMQQKSKNLHSSRTGVIRTIFLDNPKRSTLQRISSITKYITIMESLLSVKQAKQHSGVKRT